MSINSYELRNLDTQLTESFTAAYDDVSRTVTLTTTQPLEDALYELTIRGDDSVGGTTQIRDTTSNLLNNGEDSQFTFHVFGLESPDDDEVPTATASGLVRGGTAFFSTAIGNSSFVDRDVDLYAFDALTGDRITAQVFADTEFAPLGFDAALRLFDAAGNELTLSDNASGLDPAIPRFPASCRWHLLCGCHGSHEHDVQPADRSERYGGSSRQVRARPFVST